MFDLDCQFVPKASFVVLLIDVSVATHLGSQMLFYKLKRRAFKLWKCGYCCWKIAEVLLACDFYYSHRNLDKYLPNSIHTLRWGMFSALKSTDCCLPRALHPQWELLLLCSLQNSPVGQRVKAAETQYADFLGSAVFKDKQNIKMLSKSFTLCKSWESRMCVLEIVMFVYSFKISAILNVYFFYAKFLTFHCRT